MTPNETLNTELRLTADDLSKSLLTIGEAAVELNLSVAEVTGLITSGLLLPERFSDLWFGTIIVTPIFTKEAEKRITIALKEGKEIITADIENNILFTPESLKSYLRLKKVDDAIQAFSMALEKFNLSQEEVEFISDSYLMLIYSDPDDYLSNDCSGIYKKLRQLQKEHPDDWKQFVDLDGNLEWTEPDGQLIINKNGRTRKVFDYINYLKVTGPKAELNDFEEQFTLDGYPSLLRIFPIPPEDELNLQLEKYYKRDYYTEKQTKSLIGHTAEEKTSNWCNNSWGTWADIDLLSTKVFGVRGKNKIFTAFVSNPINPWIDVAQSKFPGLRFLTYTRSSNRNLWEITKTVRKKDKVTFDGYSQGEFSEIIDNPAIHKIVMKHERILHNILKFDQYFRVISSNLEKAGVVHPMNPRSHQDFEQPGFMFNEIL